MTVIENEEVLMAQRYVKDPEELLLWNVLLKQPIKV